MVGMCYRVASSLILTLISQGDLRFPKTPHFLWITEFPLFTRDDKDKEFLAQGRWSSSHHPFTAPMWQDIPAMYEGRIESVRLQFITFTRFFDPEDFLFSFGLRSVGSTMISYSMASKSGEVRFECMTQKCNNTSSPRFSRCEFFYL
jgi:hypothetical protein